MSDRPDPPSAEPAISDRALPAFSIDRVFGTSIRTFLANLVPFLTLAAVIQSPVIASNLLWHTAVVPGQPPEASPGRLIVTVLLGLVANFLITGTLTFIVYRELRRQPFTWGECLAHALRRLPAILGVSLVVGLATTLGLILCIVPGIYVLAVYAAAVPAVVVEGKGVFAAMARSKTLTQGKIWPIFGAYFLAGLVTGIPTFVATLALKQEPMLQISVTSAFQVVSVAFQAVLTCVIYYQLREAREDLDAPELAAVFD